jgi:hypothetical protein
MTPQSSRNASVDFSIAQTAIQRFMQKTVDEYQSGRMSECIALTHNYTDTQWFHIAAKVADAICFTRGRIGFLSPDGKKAAQTPSQQLKWALHEQNGHTHGQHDFASRPHQPAR